MKLATLVRIFIFEIYLNRRVQRNQHIQNRNNGFNLNVGESFEVLKQNIILMQQLWKDRKPLNEIFSADSHNFFNFQTKTQTTTMNWY